MGEYKYVYLGGGQSAGYAAREFVKRGLNPGELLIVGDEKVVSYERPTLSKGYLKPDSPPRLPGFHSSVGGGGEAQPPEWYKEKGIEYRTGTKVTEVSVKDKTIKTDSGDTIKYNKLIIATGCHATKLTDFGPVEGHDLDGIFYLRNVADADKLYEGFKTAKAKSKKAVVVGGGYIGLELTAGLVTNGFEVTMVFPEPYMMQRSFSREVADFYERYYESKGVQLMRGNTAVGFEDRGDGSVGKVVLKSGEKLDASLVIVGVGARPNVELVQGQLEMLEKAPGGIKVNGSLQTSNPDVYAVGDVAAFPLILYGGKVTRQEHVVNARSSAEFVAAAITSREVGDYEYLPFFYSREFDLSWKLYGVTTGECVVFGDTSLETHKFGAYWVDDDKVVGAFLESGTPEEEAALKEVVRMQPPAPPLEELKIAGINFATQAKSRSRQSVAASASLGQSPANGRAFFTRDAPQHKPWGSITPSRQLRTGARAAQNRSIVQSLGARAQLRRSVCVGSVVRASHSCKALPTSFASARSGALLSSRFVCL